MEGVKAELRRKGGNDADWNELLSEGLALSDLGWVDSEKNGDPYGRVKDLLCEGRLIEYQCYDVRHRPQGLAVIELLGWADEEKRLLKAVHLAASDEYYQWYGENSLVVDECVYHLCDKGHRGCGFRGNRHDGRQVIHLDRWRAVNAGLLEGQVYSHDVAVSRMRTVVNKVVPHPVSPPVPALSHHAPPVGVGGAGSGLDEALLGGGFPPMPAEVKRPEKAADERKPERKARVGQLLAERAEKFEAAAGSKHAKKKRKLKGRDDRLERKKRSRGEDGPETSSEDEKSSDSSEAPFQKLSTRAEMDIWRQSQKSPGKLLKSGLQEMGRFLADRVGENPLEGWQDRKVMAYINQVLLTQHPVQNLGIRNLREAQTLGMAIDMLMSGNLGSLGDLLMQRLKALETAVNEQSWGSARHQELIAPGSKPHESRRKRSCSQSRTPSPQTEGRFGEEQGEPQQIGSRRRGAGQQAPRDAIHVPEKQPREGRREEGQFQRRSEGGSEVSGQEPERRRRRHRRRRERHREAQEESMEGLEVEEEGQAERIEEPAEEERGRRIRWELKSVSPKRQRTETRAESSSGCQDGFDTEIDDDLVENALLDLRSWLTENDVEGLSVAQLGAHLAIQIQKSQVHLAKYLERMLASPNEEPGGNGRGASSRFRPLKIPKKQLSKYFRVVSIKGWLAAGARRKPWRLVRYIVK